ncbi:MAG TPA: hypothetical protein PLI27_10650 [Ignavibacteriales bacterium]|nr:hypothetical protein [Ignavibacteriales bacterium]HPD68519.1 hypothetical protein [Ignavibacteriales bacterium]HRR18752.1 hypothetical protein [Ignavibacteriales bacterium]HRT99744.1 hypothetical protein [Ignavibacteriales bacterium]
MQKIVLIIWIIIISTLSSLFAQGEDIFVEDIKITIPKIQVPNIQIPQIKISSDRTLDSSYVYENLLLLDKSFITDLDFIYSKNEKVYYKTMKDINKIILSKSKVLILNQTKPNDYRVKRDIPIISEEIRSIILAGKYSVAEPSQKQKILAELELTLDTLFDLREEARREEVQELKARINELENILAIRKNNKDKIIQKRLWELTEDKKFINWDKNTEEDEF